MRAQLEAIVSELRRLKAEGVTHVSVHEQTLASVKTLAKPAEKAPTQPAPVHKDHQADKRLTAFSNEFQNAAAPAVEAPHRKEVLMAHGRPARRVPGHDFIKPIPEPEPVTLPDGDRQLRYEWLCDKIKNCPICHEHVRPGKHIVIGSGALDSPIFFCGEAPGADEETQGEVFVGPAGQKLNGIIKAMGTSRDAVYVGNILNWRPEHPMPTGNRAPTQVEMDFCMPYLRAQIEIVQPKVIVALGNTAYTGLIGTKPAFSKARGQWYEFEGIPVMPTYHPSYLLRREKDGVKQANKAKRELWEHMLLVMEKVGMQISDKQRGYFA